MRAVFISQAVLNKNNGGGQFVRSLTGLLKKAIGADIYIDYLKKYNANKMV